MNRIGLVALAGLFVIIIIYLFNLEPLVKIVAWSVTIGTLLVFAIGAVYFILMTKEKFKTLQAERKKVEYEGKASKYKSFQDGFGMMHLLNLENDMIENLSAFPGTHHNGRWEEPEPVAMAAWYALVGKTSNESPATLLPQPQEQAPNLFSILAKAERVLVKGPSDSGKTTLFRNIVMQSSETVIVVDPHYKPGTWPQNCKVIGKGRNHQQISKFLDWLSEELDRRYKLRAQGKETYSPLTIIVDEWMSISTKCDNATKIITEMITESRKSKMRLFIGSHSDQVEALGIRGQGKLREGLLIVRLYYDQVTQDRRSTFDFGKGERDCHLYQPAREMVIDDPDTRFVQLIESGMSRREASLKAYNREYAGNIVSRVKQMLGER